MASTNQDRRPHVALLAFPIGTHAAPLHALARHLAASSPGSIFSFFGTARSNAPLSRVPSPANLRLYEVSDGAPEGYVPSMTNPEEEIELFSKVTPGNFRDAMEVVMREEGGARVSCVVGDSFLWFAGDMAEEMGAPWVALWTGGLCSLSAHVHTEDIRQTIGVGQQVILEHGDRSLDFISGLSDFRVRDLQEGVVIGNLNSVLSILLYKMGQEMHNATAVILNTIEGLEPEVLNHLKTKFKTCLPVGPLNLLSPLQSPANYQDPFNCLSWLDNQAPTSVAYIGFGTVVSPSEEELVALAKALEASKVPFIWSLKEKFVNRLPTGFLESTRSQGLVVSWAPQVDVLGHAAVGVFLTHCGWNSVTESISVGVPMMCRPFFGDQRLNARAASHMWKIGLVADGGVLMKDWVVEALDVVLKTEEGKKMRERAATLKELAKNAIGPKGSSVKNLEALNKIIQALVSCNKF